jgi:predicted nucleic acid-binding protein
MPIVSNTSPVLNLAIVNHLSLMYEQFGEILIPQAVFEKKPVFILHRSYIPTF